MPSAYRRSFMHEEDGAGKDPVPLEKRSKSVERTERQQEPRMLQNAKRRMKITLCSLMYYSVCSSVWKCGFLCIF